MTERSQFAGRFDSLRDRVCRDRSRWQRVRILEACGWAVSGAVGYFLAAVLLDNVAHLPVIGRLLVAGGLVAVVAYLVRQVLRRWGQRHATEDEIALTIERRTIGGVQNRLINALQIGREAQFSEPGMPSAEIGAMLLEENWRALAARPLPAAAAVRPAAAWLLLALGLVLVSAGAWVWHPTRFATSVARILLPFAAIDPVYRTVLLVEPGDIEAAGDVTIRVRIRGQRPPELTFLVDEPERRSTHVVPVADDGDVTYTVQNIEHSLAYAVHGGDFTSPYYHIDVPQPARLVRVLATYQFPAYTKLADKSVETSGDLEAVQGTRASVTFVLDHPADAAKLIVRGNGNVSGRPERSTALSGKSPGEFAGAILFDDVTAYAIETRQGGRSPQRSQWHAVRVIRDEPPKIDLAGLPASGEVPIDEAVSVTVKASDDFGLARAGLFARRVLHTAAPQQRPASNGGPEQPTSAVEEEGWVPVSTWPVDGKAEFEQSCELLAASLGAIEGERLTVVARASDFHPDRKDHWTAGPVYVLLVVGEGAQLQIVYEQILRSEAELAGCLASEKQFYSQTDGWIRGLDADPAGGANAQRVQELITAATAQSRQQDQLRQSAGRTAREMVAQAGNLRLSVGMLADTEMARAIRILESVATRDDAAGRRSALADARATQQRTIQSLEQIQEQYVRFRQDWELAHMTSVLRMLADRQAALADDSERRAEAGVELSAAQRETAARRQQKLVQLCALAETAFAGLGERVADVESQLAEAFSDAAASLGSDELKEPMAAAQEALAAGEVQTAVSSQRRAAALLDAIHNKLHDAQLEAARRVLAALEDAADSDLAAQAELEKLKAGSNENLLDDEGGLKLEDIIHMAEVERDRSQDGKDKEPYANNYLFPDSARGMLDQPDTGKRQEFDILKLAKSPGGEPSFPKQSDREGNRVKPHMQEKFDDLVGDLLEEEDAMKANYETYNLNTNANINEPGEVGKQAGDLNSTAASAATGNQKPPTTNVGGASRVGRQGARAFGAAVGNESINRRGRDKVQEGQERSADQAGSVRETKSEDPQQDTSTGIGGRKVESDDAKFSLSDAGQWTDDMAERMDKPRDKQSIVERQGARLDASVAESMRDMTSRHEQIIERLKTIRKDLKNLYLPTEQLDELIDQMQAHLATLSERPTGEVYRLQQETLQQVRGLLTVFHQAHSGFQASLPREQAVRGRVLDDPARTVPPGYETAVKNYYQRLASP